MKIDPRWWIGLLALFFGVNYAFNNSFLPFSGMPELGIQFKLDGQIPRVFKVERGSPYGLAGVAPGDLIVAVGNQQVISTNDYFLLAQLLGGDRHFELQVERAGKLKTLQVRWTGSYFDSLAPLNRGAFIFWLLIGALELVLALSLALSRPKDPSALSAASFLAVLSTLSAQSVGWAHSFRELPWMIKPLIYIVCLIVLEIPFFAFLFCATFPRPLLRARKHWIWVCLPAFLIYLFLAGLNLPLLFGSQPELLFRSRIGILYLGLQLPIIAVMATYALASVAVLVINYRRCGRVERRRIQLMLAGALVGLASVVPSAILNHIVYSDVISRSGLISIAFGLLRIIFLTCLVYAVLKQKVFEIPVLLRRSGRYLLVQRGYLIVLGLAGIGSTLIFARVLARTFPAAATYSIAIGVLFGIALIWLGSIMHKRVQHRLDRAFFRSAYDAQLLLEEMAERSRRSTSRAGLMDILRHHLEKALHPAALMILMEDVKGRLESSEQNGLPALSLDASAPRLKALGRSGKAVELTEEDWQKEEFKDLAPLRPECLVPIIGRTDRLLGLAALGAKLSEEPYSSSDLRLLQSAARHAGVALENISLAEDIALRLETERMAAHDLAIAREVQSKLLPGSAPMLTSLQCTARCIQAKQVGGDFYDFIEYGSGKVGLVLADIAGKGISAALLMASLQAQLRSQRISSPADIAAALQSVNRNFRKSIEVGGFATLFFGLYDDATGVFTYANCGHAPAVVMRRDGTVRRLESTATVIGAFADWQCEVEQIDLAEEDVLVLYSDGITEAENDSGELFGEGRLLELLHGCKDLSSGQLVDVIVGGALDFSRNQQIDDITLVVGKALGVPASAKASASGQLKAKA